MNGYKIEKNSSEINKVNLNSRLTLNKLDDYALFLK